MNNKKTCFSECNRLKESCKNNTCRYWHSLKDYQNCVLNKSVEGPYTLQEVGDLFNITRMRVCQIEKSVIEKIKKSLINY